MGKKPKPFRVWATMAFPDGITRKKPSVCLWGERASAEDGRDVDEVVCLVRVEIVRIPQRQDPS